MTSVPVHLAHHAFPYARVPERALHWGVRLQAAVLINALGTFHPFLPGFGVSVLKSLPMNVIWFFVLFFYSTDVHYASTFVWGGSALKEKKMV